MFIPKETKFKKQFKGRKFNKIGKPKELLSIYNSLNIIRLRSLGHSRITDSQLFSLRQTVVKKLKKQGRFSIKLFADTPVSKKPLEIRMGKGKGAVNSWVAKLIPGATIIELYGVSDVKAFNILKEIQKKLPLNTYIDCLKK